MRDTTKPVTAVFVIFDRGWQFGNLYFDPEVTAFAERHRLALVLARHCRSKEREDMDVVPQHGIGRALLAASGQLAADSHHPELASSKLIVYSFSGGGSLVAKERVCRWGLIIALAGVVAGFAQTTSSEMTMRLKVDHATVCGSELEPMREAFANIGLGMDYGGPQPNDVTHMALLGFEDGSYLEFIAPMKAGESVPGFTSSWEKLMAGNAGPCAWAVAIPDIKQEVERLKTAGISTGELESRSRKRPDGMAIEWTTADVGSGPSGAMLPFIIQDRTPRDWRVQPSASVRNSGLIGIDAVVLGVNNLDKAVALFQQAYGWPPPVIEQHWDFDAKLAYFPGEPVILASPLPGRSWLAEHLQKFGEAPVGFVLQTQNFDAAAKRFHISYNITWFGQKFAWFDRKKLHGVRLGIWGQ